MTQKTKKITVDGYCKQFRPQPGFVLIEKDKAGEKSGSIYVSQTTRDKMRKWAGSGIIRVKSPLKAESDYDNYLQEFYAVGDHVAFNSMTPLDAPLPLNYQFEEREVSLVLIHIGDLLGWFQKEEA